MLYPERGHVLSGAAIKQTARQIRLKCIPQKEEGGAILQRAGTTNFAQLFT